MGRVAGQMGARRARCRKKSGARPKATAKSLGLLEAVDS